jgi:hypothetical protein
MRDLVIGISQDNRGFDNEDQGAFPNLTSCVVATPLGIINVILYCTPTTTHKSKSLIGSLGASYISTMCAIGRSLCKKQQPNYVSLEIGPIVFLWDLKNNYCKITRDLQNVGLVLFSKEVIAPE